MTWTCVYDLITISSRLLSNKKINDCSLNYLINHFLISLVFPVVKELVAINDTTNPQLSFPSLSLGEGFYRRTGLSPRFSPNRLVSLVELWRVWQGHLHPVGQHLRDRDSTGSRWSGGGAEWTKRGFIKLHFY